MRPYALLRFLLIICLLLAVTSTSAYGESTVTQTFTLYPGWNAIFLQVQPDPREPSEVFNGIGNLESVWAWISRNTTIEFIQNPDEGLWNKPGWCAYYTSEEEGFLTNLHAVFANWPYLIKIDGEGLDPEEGIPWSVTGTPSSKEINWVPDSFNLVGFNVSKDTPPNFLEFFKYSPAHAGQAVYQLNRTGKWEFIDKPSETLVKSGEAYWVYCESASSYQGSLKVSLPTINGLNFGSLLSQTSFTMENLSDSDRNVTLNLISDTIVLEYRVFDSSTGFFLWKPLGEIQPILIKPDMMENVQLAVRREEMPAGYHESILEIEDNKGIKILAPVVVEKLE